MAYVHIILAELCEYAILSSQQKYVSRKHAFFEKLYCTLHNMTKTTNAENFFNNFCFLRSQSQD